MTGTLQQTVLTGSLLLAVPVAVAAGLVSFLSPCVLPLVPGYLSYVTGLAGADLQGDGLKRARLVAGALLFVLGFTAVFVSFGAFFGGLGSVLLTYAPVLTKVLGAMTIVLGLVFLGAIPYASRTLKLSTRPSVGLTGAPLLGAFFAIGWTPCVGPTLAAVQALAFTESSAGRGALLAAAYCLGLGVPFVAAALLYRRTLGAFGWVRQRSVWVMRAGGAMLVAVGVLLLTGAWTDLTIRMQGWISGFETVL